MQKSVIQVDLFCGEVALVEPLSPFTYTALNNAAEQEFPDVDTAPFEKPVEDAAPGLGLKVIDRKNPEYIRLVNEVARNRVAYVRRVSINLNVCFEGGKETLIRKYADRLGELGKFIELPDDEWEATWQHALITRQEDLANIDRALFSNAALEEGEIVAGMKTFRLKV